MAYTSLSDQYKIINPREERLPYDLLVLKELEELEKKAEQYFEWFNSAPEILKRHKESAELGKSIEDRLSAMQEALNSGDIRTAKLLGRGMLQDKATYNNWSKKAKILENLIKEQRSKPGYAFSKVYNENTSLNDIDETSSYDSVALSDYATMGALIGAQLNNSAPPEVIGSILNNTLALVRSGVSQEKALDYWENNTGVKDYVNDMITLSGITDLGELAKLRNYIFKGMMSQIKQSVATTLNLDVTKRISAAKGKGSGTVTKNTDEDSLTPTQREALYAALEKLRIRIINDRYLEDLANGNIPSKLYWYEDTPASDTIIKYTWIWNESKARWEKKEETVKIGSTDSKSRYLNLNNYPIDKPNYPNSEVTDEDRLEDNKTVSGQPSQNTRARLFLRGDVTYVLEEGEDEIILTQTNARRFGITKENAYSKYGIDWDKLPEK